MPSPIRSTARDAGVALIIVLAFLVLLTGLTVAFFSRATTERQVSSSNAAQTQADLLARSASDLIVADLKQEIAAGSTAYTPVAGTTIYTPTADARPNPPSAPIPPVVTPSVVPWVSGVPVPTAGQPPPIPNLLRRSVRAGDATVVAYPATYYNPPQNLASAVNSATDVSANGRSVSPAQWNAHYLIPAAGAASFVAPDWVMVTRSGPKVLTAPDSTVIGRYAYAIYDEGGLLDANVAGCPSNVTGTDNLSDAKGFAAFADLTALGLTQAQVDKLIGWRNHATTKPTGSLAGGYTFGSASAANYVAYVLGQANGFLTINGNALIGSGPSAQTDQAFANRQSLIRFFTTAGMDRSALQYLGTFTRDLNKPNFVPLANPYPGAALSPGAIITYPVPTQTNPNPLQTGVPVAGNEPNPIPQNVLITAGPNTGQPLITRRFPLGTITLLANPTANATAIKHYFGLTYSAAAQGTAATGLYQWKYSHTVPVSSGSATSILSLSQVAALTGPRETGTDPVTGLTYRQEPDFFEYLQAAVLYGSLGNYNPSASATIQTSTTPPNGYFSGSGVGFNGASKPSQFCENIVKMGLNLIDQYDADNFPTVVYFNNQTYAGIENLPYLSEFLLWPYRPINTSPANAPTYISQGAGITTVGDPDRLNLAVFGMIELWNPHQNAAAIAATGFPQLRLQVQSGQANSSLAVYAYAAPDGGYSLGPMTTELPNGKLLNITFSNSASFQEPNTLGSDSNASSTDGNWYAMIDAPTAQRSGFLLGVARCPDKDLSGVGSVRYQFAKIDCANSYNAPILTLQFTMDGTTWLNYQGANASFPGSPPVSTFTLPINESELSASVPTGARLPSPFGSPQITSDTSFSNYRYIGQVSAQVPDPRTKSNQSLASSESTFGLTIRPGKPDGSTGSYSGAAVRRYSLQYPSDYVFPTSVNGHSFTPNPPYLGMYNENDSSPSNAYFAANVGNNPLSNSYYVDPDGVARPGDGYYGGNPLVKGNMPARPLLLNRPFRSVGEMGYAYRGWGVWKSINFFGEQSADAGLLDYFSVDTAPVAAGKINLNTRQPKVLQAMLQGAYRIEPINASPTDALSAADADNLAKAIVNHTSATTPPAASAQSTPPYIPGPLVSRADLVRGLLGDPKIIAALSSIQGSLAIAGGTNPDQGNTTKTRREALVRALADVGTTRTWDLLIDLVAQSGGYAANATDLKKGFVVQGEKHYWLHVALDRYTGAVIDQQMEVVSE